MKHLMKRSAIICLAAVMLLSCLLTACNRSTGNSNPGKEPTIPIEDTTVFHQKTFDVNGVIIDKFQVLSNDADINRAHSELASYLEKMGMTKDDGGYRITLEIDSTLPEEGYRITVNESNEEGMTIQGGSVRGVLYGVYGFLEKYAGVRFFTPKLETCNEGNIELTSGVYEFSPILEHRQIDWYSVRFSPQWMVKNGINCCDWYGAFPDFFGGSVNYNGLFVHTFTTITDTPSNEQPCLTDPEILEKAITYIRQYLEKHPDATILSVSQNDNWNYCKCENCEAIAKEEGSPAGTLLRFVNAIADEFAEEYPKLTFDTLAYQWTQTAPKITKPRENVCVRLCSILCDFTHPLNDDLCAENRKFQSDIEAWSKICDNLYIWDYTNNYRYSVPTYANLYVLRENMQFYVSHNVKGMFPQGNCYSASGEFGELRAYLLAKLMMDPMMSEETYNTHMNEFLRAYYGSGWEYIRKYIDEVCAEAATGCQSIYGHPFEAVPRRFWKDKEATFNEYWNKAEELAGNRITYVQRSRLQWKYIQLMLHPNEEDAKKLIAQITSMGIYWNESGITLPSDADLTLGPDSWFTFDWWL